MGFFEWFHVVEEAFHLYHYINDHHEKADVSVECEDSADNGVINIDNSYITIYNF